MALPFRPRSGDLIALQQTPTTCGSACLTVARMRANPQFAQWISSGIHKDARDDDVPDAGTMSKRFAAYEQVVAGRTNAMRGAGGRWQLPWPRALGTPPWGARNELEFGAADPSADYDISWLRPGGRARRERAYDRLVERVTEGTPALLYIGNRRIPRHVVLVMPSTGAGELDVYEPSIGRVIDLPREPFVNGTMRMAGWDLPWAIVWNDPR